MMRKKPVTIKEADHVILNRWRDNQEIPELSIKNVWWFNNVKRCGYPQKLKWQLKSSDGLWS